MVREKTPQQRNGPEGPGELFFSEVQMVIETVAGEGCTENLARQERGVKKLRFRVDDEGKLLFLRRDWTPKYYVLNFSMQVMGFDKSRFVFSSLDGFIPKSIPYDFKVSRVRGGGGVIEMEYLDQVVHLDLIATPFYSFAAKEDRDGCEISHNVNVFAENTGAYEFFK